MDFLQVKDGKVVDGQGQPVFLRGVCVGGWMNMEDFIDGYPGAEHTLRAVMANELGAGKAQFFFDRLLDYFLAEEDIAFMKGLGATAVRLSLNYRHFERDAQPFTYLESGFQRLDQAIRWCEKHSLYAILDMHSVQGWQNSDWHCDNASRHSLFWVHPHFQDRWVALWEELARRYAGNPTVAGFNVMNEPLVNATWGRFSSTYTPGYDLINRSYRRVVNAIRAIDPKHIIFLEGDYFSSRFEGLDAPFAENLVYSSHNYTNAGFGPGPYPGEIRGEYWEKGKIQTVFERAEGTRFTQKHQAPLWVGEFGSVFNGPAHEAPDRLRAFDDTLSVYEDHDAHWTAWTYKDVGVMGWVMLDPEAEYLQVLKPVHQAKIALSTDFWMGWLPVTQAKAMVNDLAHHVEGVLCDPDIQTRANEHFLGQAALSGYVAALMQPAYAKRFKGMSEADLDRVLQSFAFKNCRPNAALMDIVKKHLA
jgi:aryl-phospho-beta-D-glucosidase BglC (GH1 family)